VPVHDRCVPHTSIVAFLGSPRPHGNTDTLAEAVLEGARSAGCAVQSIALRSLRLHHCTGCGHCGRQGRLCIFRDDGDQLYQAAIDAEVLLFVTPVYWYGPTSILKTFLDRLVVFNTPETRPLVRGKAAGLVAAWEEKGPEAAEPMVKLFELGFRYLELRPAGSLLVDGAGPKDAVRSMPGILDRARSFGAGLA
jgi:multimeric flavodoxin WrbA